MRSLPPGPKGPGFRSRGPMKNYDSIYTSSLTGNKSYWLSSKLHRLNGPAIEYLDGSKKWYINGERIYCET
jgi:hypothetical protein